MDDATLDRPVATVETLEGSRQGLDGYALAIPSIENRPGH